MEEEPAEVPPTQAFVEQEGDTIEQFCEHNYADSKGECVAFVTDRLVGGERPPQQDETVEVNDRTVDDDPVVDTVSDDGEQKIETLIADCSNTGLLGIRGGDQQACLRAVAQHERLKYR